jgi:predicted Co/Zn/Cd cation transporter (cation efflux family)
LITQSNRQRVFSEMLSGILLYSVVLGFFNDYTDIIHTGTYSTTFAVAVVMEILTFLTIALKDRVLRWLNGRGRPPRKAAVVFSLWLIMFLSKFVFLAAISAIFRGEVQVSNFFGLLLIIACMTIAQKLLDLAYASLGDEPS